MTGLEEFLPLVTNASPAAIIGAGAFFYYKVSTKRLEDTKAEYMQRIAELKEEHGKTLQEMKEEVELERGERKRYRDLYETTIMVLPDLTRELGELADSIKNKGI
mgnify:FL=1|tara:strand:+ start:393 stop:707 length:315 start_codon:yes stop_codon:yes gene_type:complete